MNATPSPKRYSKPMRMLGFGYQYKAKSPVVDTTSAPQTPSRWTPARTIFVALGIVGILLFGAMTMTVPVFAATAPAVLTIGAAVLTYLAWPKKR